MVLVGKLMTRCGVTPVDCHHMIRRSQGGGMLDDELETKHLICLCRKHHNWVHRRVGVATELGLFLEGAVLRDGTRLVYKGPEIYFTQKYGEDAGYEIQGLGSSW